MIELVYMSHAQYIFNEVELIELLEIAREKNNARNVTGMLLYDGFGTFIQAIEGEKEQIDELYKIISQDMRHTGIQQLSYNKVLERSFSDWEMGYKRITDKDTKKLDGYSNFMGEDQDDGNALSFGLEMLNHFRQNSD